MGEKGVDIDTKDAKGQTPLFAACEEGTKETVKWLIDRGADPDASAKSERAGGDWTDCKTLMFYREASNWLTIRDYEKMYLEYGGEEDEEEEDDDDDDDEDDADDEEWEADWDVGDEEQEEEERSS